jgi:WD40 repeat protein
MPENPKPGVIGLSLTRDGNTLLASGADGVIRIWDVSSGKLKRTLTGHTNAIYEAELSPDEKLIASSSRDTTVRIWDYASGRELHRYTAFKCSVKAVAFSPEGNLLAAAGNDGVIKVLDVGSGRELLSLVHTDSGDVDTSVYSLAFGRDGRTIFAGNGDGTISEWSVRSGKETNTWKAHTETVIALALSPDRKMLASDGYNEANVKLWDARTKREIRTLGGKTADGLIEQSHAVAFSPDGKLIAFSVTGFDEKLRQFAYTRTYVWDVRSGAKLFTFEGQRFDVGGLVFTPDGRFLIAGSADTTIKLYDLKTGRESRTITQK